MMIYMKKLRKEKNLTMKKLGELVGVSESAISQYESLKRKPEYETTLKLCEVLGCSAPNLFIDESKVIKPDRAIGSKRRTKLANFLKMLSKFTKYSRC